MEANKIIITGGAARIGAAIAKNLSGPGVEIVIHYNKSKINAEKVSNKIFNEFQRLHDLLHPWEKSIITDINRSYNSSLNSKYKVRVFKETMERVKNYFR